MKDLPVGTKVLIDINSLDHNHWKGVNFTILGKSGYATDGYLVAWPDGRTDHVHSDYIVSVITRPITLQPSKGLDLDIDIYD